MIIIRDTKQLVRELIEVIDRTQRSITTKDLESAMKEAIRKYGGLLQKPEKEKKQGGLTMTAKFALIIDGLVEEINDDEEYLGVLYTTIQDETARTVRGEIVALVPINLLERISDYCKWVFHGIEDDPFLVKMAKEIKGIEKEVNGWIK